MNRIDEVLIEQGRKRTWLAKQIGCHYSSIYAFCVNRNQPNIGQLKKISDVLGVSMESLIKES